jgi:hypothetical protein
MITLSGPPIPAYSRAELYLNAGCSPSDNTRVYRDVKHTQPSEMTLNFYMMGRYVLGTVRSGTLLGPILLQIFPCLIYISRFDIF